jgi:hypothetical protein
VSRVVLARAARPQTSREIRALLVIPFAALLLAALLSGIEAMRRQDPARDGARAHQVPE